MKRKLAIIHTTPTTVAPLKALAVEMVPDITVINFVDDSILPQLAENEGDIRLVENRLEAYARFAEEVGAEVILEACSSVGEVVEKMRRAVSVPVVRIDEAMAEKAVERGEQIGVAATLATTLGPTTRLIEGKAQAAMKPVRLEPRLVAEAYEKLAAGDQEGHDRALATALTELVENVDVVVLAQASMARVLPQLPGSLQKIFLSSPRLGMEQVRKVLEDRNG